MRKFTLLGLLVFVSISLKASHFIGAYFEYKVDSVQQELEVRLHVILDSTGIPMTQTSFLLQGPVATNLIYDGNPPVYFPIGSINCTGRAYYERVFVGYVNLNATAMQSPGRKIFSADFACCNAPTANVDTNSEQYLELSIWPSIDVNGNYYYPEFDNTGRNPLMVQSAYPDIRNYLNFGLSAQPLGRDSSNHRLLDAQRAANTSMTYQSGYSGITPLPDQSEDPRNGAIIYDPQQRMISSQAVAGSYNAGLYLLRFRNQYFRNGAPYIVDDCLPLVYYFDRDTTLTDSLVTQIERNGQSLATPRATQAISINAGYLENIQLDLNAYAGLGDSIFLVASHLSLDTAKLNLPAGTNFNVPSLISLNPAQSLNALDTNKLSLQFQTQRDNFLFGPKQYRYTLNFLNARCDGFAATVTIEINLEDKAFLFAPAATADSLIYCLNTNPALEALNAQSGAYWSPGSWVQDSTAIQTQLSGNNSGWLYLVRADGLRQDSVYLKSESPQGILPLQPGIFETIYHNASATAANQTWMVSNLIEVKPSQKNRLPILGSGTYSYVNDYGLNRCKEYSDTFTVQNKFLWNNSFGVDQASMNGVKKDTSVNEQYAIRLSMPNDARYISKIFFYGFRNLDPSQPKPLKLKLTTSYGYQDSADFVISNQGFVEFPVNFDLGPGLQAELVVTIGAGLEYQYIFYNQAGFTRNTLRFSDMRNGPVGANLAVRNYRLPLGFRYKGQIGLAENEAQPAYDLYPNPSAGKLYLNWYQAAAAEGRIYSTTGQLLKQIKVQKGANVLDLNLKPGLYYLNFPAHPQWEARSIMIK